MEVFADLLYTFAPIPGASIGPLAPRDFSFAGRVRRVQVCIDLEDTVRYTSGTCIAWGGGDQQAWVRQLFYCFVRTQPLLDCSDVST